MSPKAQGAPNPKALNRKALKKDRSHAAILASAAGLLRKQGIRRTSVMDVMKGAGLTVGGFYGHFDSKEQLFREAIQGGPSTMWQRMLASATGATPQARVRSVVRRYLSPSHRDNPETGCVLPSAAPEVAREGEQFRCALESKVDTVAGSLAGMLGGRSADRETALGLIALMYGALSLSRAVAGTPLSDELLKAARALSDRALADEDSRGRRH